MRSACRGPTVWWRLCVIMAMIVQSAAGDDVISDPDCTDPGTHYPAAIEPTHVRIREGAELNITCSVEPRCQSRFNASDLYFLKTVPEFYANSSRVRLLSGAAIQLNLAMAREEQDRGIWMCLVKGLAGRGLIKYTSHVQFVRFPLVPEIVSCIVDNWEVMTCRWKPSYYQQLVHTKENGFVYKFIYSSGNGTTSYCCPETDHPCWRHELTDDFCQLRLGNGSGSFQMGVKYNLTVRAESGDQFEIGQWLNYDPSLHVRPGAPENVTMTAHNRSHYSIVWLPPAAAWEEAKRWTFNYSVVVSTKYETQNFYTSETQFILPVHPYTEYSIKVRVRPIQSGFWSKETAIQFVTEMREPDANPATFPAGYSLSCKPLTDTCDVRIYWQPLAEWQTAGPGFLYKILTRELDRDADGARPGNWSLAKAVSDYRKNSESISISNRRTTQVAVLASNAVGDSATNVSLVWIDPANRRSNITEGLIIECADVNMKAWLEGVSPKTMTNSASYVIFWQNKEIKPGNILSHGWMPLTKARSNVFRASMKLPCPCHQYEYSLAEIITDYEGIRTSGLLKYRDCLYAYESEHVSPPANVEIVDRSKNSLSVRWSAPQCAINTAYIIAYHVFYCKKDEHLNTCEQPLVRVEMEVARHVRSLTLTNLGADTVYLVYVSSLALHSDKESVRVLASGPSRTLPGLSVGVIVGLLFLSVLAAVVAGLGVRFYWRGCVRLKRWYTKGVVITMPQESATQNGLYTRSNFLLRTSGDNSRFSAVVSDIYGMDIRRQTSTVSRDSPTPRHSVGLCRNRCTSSDDVTLSPQSSDSGCQFGVVCTSTNPDITRYTKASYVTATFPRPDTGLAVCVLSNRRRSIGADRRPDESLAGGANGKTYSSLPDVDRTDSARSILDASGRPDVNAEQDGEATSGGAQPNYVTESEWLRRSGRANGSIKSRQSPVSLHLLGDNDPDSPSKLKCRSPPPITVTDPETRYVTCPDIGSDVRTCHFTSSAKANATTDVTWAYVSHDFIYA